MKWKIGNVKIDNQVVLAPMAGITDSAFRRIAKSMGCGLLSTEMVSDKALMYENSRTQEMLYMTPEERPISQQIFGAEAESFKIATEYICKNMKPDIIDINMGCPVPKVAVRSKAGSALLKNPEKISEIVETVVETSDVPVTAKIRSGWDNTCINALEVAGIVEDAGASAITVHPRTREQRYGENADWSIIKEVKDALNIPVIGNGDIHTCHDAKRMIDETGCDAIMIGRGVLGNPWLIKQCIDYLDYDIEPQKVTLEEKLEMIKIHAELLSQIRSEKPAMHKMRTHTAYYLKGQWRSAEIKPKIFKMNTKEELFDLLDEYVELIS
ncbi:MAG: tRNA dihydrouridine synthase DusB [Methanobrevibacter sp.]|uniref:tRNA dihydrouridine synthase DusB n=1 Tax=Methanobrevibacter sp. TaxID=66852 RepID=UPI0025DBF8D3|nr:tRNA dihydrouridine synthase DusB [Methanobrevibacter sp.]MBQ8017657.1 tRNA dihydrouridine synthase DusB [Methanobrevibacter sp.]MBR1611242.1 tRNA dihydrouridine synthase DusB [Methanobrevibacter sp.]